MGIQTEYNPDLALRDISEFDNENRKKEECIPSDIKEGETYDFLKKGQRNYWIEGEIPLLMTKGNQVLSKPLAGIIILEATHFMNNNEPYTKGRYKVVEIFKDDRIRFNGFDKIE
ncbi:MAG: hypothetical protein ABII01_04635 [Candidatus Woesearchaeota archaeon]